MITAPDLDSLSTVLARDLRQGDEIANVGTVNAPPQPVGVFFVVEVYQYEWFLGTGKAQITHRNVVLHSEDSVIVVQEG